MECVIKDTFLQVSCMKWIKTWGVQIASERKIRLVATEMTSVVAESALLPFQLKSGREELKPAPIAYLPFLKLKMIDLLDKNERYVHVHVQALTLMSVLRLHTLTWHNGRIPPNKVWVKLGGDKGGSSFKMISSFYNLASQCIQPNFK